MKKVIFLGCLFAISVSGTGQIREVFDAAKPKKPFEGTPTLVKNSSVVSLSIGTTNKLADFLTFGGVATTIGTSSNKRSFGPLMMDYEYLVTDNIGIGTSILIATASSNYNVFGKDYTGDIAQYQVGLSSYYHFYPTDKLDPYIKATVGINIWDGKYKDNNNKKTGNFVAPTTFALRSLVGMRYFLTDKVALQGEGSITFSPNFNAAANIGIAYKIN